MLRWFGQIKRVDKYRMVRRVLTSDISGGRVRGDRGYRLDGFREDGLCSREMTVEALRQ